MQTKTNQTKTQKAVNQPKQETTPLIKHNSTVSGFIAISICISNSSRSGAEL
jgi:hypothetical protein